MTVILNNKIDYLFNFDSTVKSCYLKKKLCYFDITGSIKQFLAFLTKGQFRYIQDIFTIKKQIIIAFLGFKVWKSNNYLIQYLIIIWHSVFVFSYQSRGSQMANWAIINCSLEESNWSPFFLKLYQALKVYKFCTIL